MMDNHYTVLVALISLCFVPHNLLLRHDYVYKECRTSAIDSIKIYSVEKPYTEDYYLLYPGVKPSPITITQKKDLKIAKKVFDNENRTGTTLDSVYTIPTFKENFQPIYDEIITKDFFEDPKFADALEIELIEIVYNYDFKPYYIDVIFHDHTADTLYLDMGGHYISQSGKSGQSDEYQMLNNYLLVKYNNRHWAPEFDVFLRFNRTSFAKFARKYHLSDYIKLRGTIK